MAEMQARYIAATFSGKIPRPSDKALEAGVQSFEAARAASAFQQYDPTVAVCEALGDELRVTPSWWQTAKNPVTLLCRPVHACYYRSNPAVDGPEKAERFRKLFDEYIANPITVSD